MQSTQPPSTSAPAQSLPQSQSRSLQQPPQPILSGLFPANIPSFGNSGNFYQQQLQQQLQKQLLSRQQPGQFQLPGQFATPEQRYHAILQQQTGSQQSTPALSSLVHALGGETPGRVAQSVASIPQLPSAQALHTQPAQSKPTQPQPAGAGLDQQPAAQSQPPRHDQQHVLTRFSGPASSSFQPHALAPRTSLYANASHMPPAAASAPLQHATQHAETVRSAAAPSRESAGPVPAATSQPPRALAEPRPAPTTSAAAAHRPEPVAAVERQHTHQPAEASDDGFDEVPQVLKPPPPGKVVWAKLARYPWWPAEVLNISDSYIPEGEEPPRLGAVPVRFFGTYAFSWIESKRAIEPFDDEHMEHAANSRQPQFQRGVSEAKHFQLTGELPHGFTAALQQFYDEQQKAKSKSAAKGGKSTDEVKEVAGKGGKKGGGKRQYDDPVAAEHARHRAVTARRLRILRHLGLAPPAGSPFAAATAPCLDGFGPIAAQLGYVQPTAVQ